VGIENFKENFMKSETRARYVEELEQRGVWSAQTMFVFLKEEVNERPPLLRGDAEEKARKKLRRLRRMLKAFKEMR
jgi:hypothetical protein